MQRAFGAQALGEAAIDIKRQQEAGVTSLYGQQLAGAGGLTERAGAAALGARGVQNQGLAQVFAGTTAEEENVKARIRGLGGMLGETGQAGVEMAQQTVNTANMQIQQAQIQVANMAQGGAQMPGFARGGVVYASNGMFVPRGTDTVPAMLTPGEFVVNRAAVNRGNNLQILQAMNNGGANTSANSSPAAMSNGGVVYREVGGPINGGMNMANIANALLTFNSEFSKNLDRLSNISFTVKLDATNINVNLNGGSFLSNLTDQLKQQLFAQVGTEIANYRVGDGGKLVKSGTVL